MNESQRGVTCMLTEIGSFEPDIEAYFQCLINSEISFLLSSRIWMSKMMNFLNFASELEYGKLDLLLEPMSRSLLILLLIILIQGVFVFSSQLKI